MRTIEPIVMTAPVDKCVAGGVMEDTILLLALVAWARTEFLTTNDFGFENFAKKHFASYRTNSRIKFSN